MLSNLMRFLSLSIAEYYWQKSLTHIEHDEFEGAYTCILKCLSSTKLRTYRFLLVYSYVLVRKGLYFDAVREAESAISIIKRAKKLNDDEKKYLILYATDMINIAYTSSDMACELRPRYVDYDENSIASDLKANFPVLVNASKK